MPLLCLGVGTLGLRNFDSGATVSSYHSVSGPCMQTVLEQINGWALMHEFVVRWAFSSVF